MSKTVQTLYISAHSSYRQDIGKTIYSSKGKVKGQIVNVIGRYCAGCGCFGPAYSVKWEDGKRTYPCPAGCKVNADGTISIA